MYRARNDWQVLPPAPRRAEAPNDPPRAPVVVLLTAAARLSFVAALSWSAAALRELLQR
jgi:hypothetical protein